MPNSRRPATSIAVLVIYFAGVVAGGFHHHAPQTTGARGPETHGFPNAIGAESCNDDPDDCALCAAIHQAKVASPHPVMLALGALFDEVAIRSPSQPAPLFHTAAHARAPPTL